MSAYNGIWFIKLFAIFTLLIFSSSSYANDLLTEIENATVVSGIVKGAGVDRYTFNVFEGSSFAISVSETGDQVTGFMPELNLIGPDGDYGGGGGGNLFYKIWELEPLAGDWTVEISRADGGEIGGSYELRLVQVPGAEGVPLRFGQEYAGEIFRGGIDIYNISGIPDVTAQITLIVEEGTGFVPEIFVFAPRGEIEGASSCTDICNVNLSMTEHGHYTVVIGREDHNDGKGTYSLSVKRSEDPGATQAVSQNVSLLVPVWPKRLAVPRHYAQIYINGMFLNFSSEYPTPAEREAANNGNPLMQLYLGDRAYPDVKTAVEWWKRAAEQGDADARNRLGMIDAPDSTDKKYESAAWYRLIVDQGLPDSELQRANQYLTGRGAGQDFGQALKLYREAAEQGSVIAKFNLAVLHTLGLEAQPDFVAAAKWYEKAAEKGHVAARSNLGELYEHGVGVAQDYNRAAKLYEKAAEAGYPPALYRLGRLAATGRGMPKDMEKAATWLKKAAAAGHVDAQGELAALEGRKAEALKLWQKTAAFGNRISLRRLIEAYRKNGIHPDDYDDVLEIYRLASIGANQEAFAGLGDLFGKQSPPDYPEAYFWYRLAEIPVQDPYLTPDKKSALITYVSGEADRIEENLSPEQVAVAKWRIKDRTPQPLTDEQQAAADTLIRGLKAWQDGNYADALLFWLQADHQDLAPAQYALARAFQTGAGVPRNLDKAIEYYSKAVRNGNVRSATAIGTLYHFGIGVPTDLNEAAKWYEMDASRGYIPAIKRLGWLYLHGMEDGAEKAVAMYEKAVARDVLEANDALGMIYLYGAGVPKDHQKALKWYLKAADQYSPTGRIQASAILAKYEPRDYGRALRLVSDIITPVALNNRAFLYELEIGVNEQEGVTGRAQPTALELYKRAADMCYGRAMYHIGRLLATGADASAVSATPVPKDADAAHDWMKRAARYGSTAAAIWLEKAGRDIPLEEVSFPPPPCDEKESP